MQCRSETNLAGHASISTRVMHPVVLARAIGHRPAVHSPFAIANIQSQMVLSSVCVCASESVIHNSV